MNVLYETAKAHFRAVENLSYANNISDAEANAAVIEAREVFRLGLRGVLLKCNIGVSHDENATGLVEYVKKHTSFEAAQLSALCSALDDMYDDILRGNNAGAGKDEIQSLNDVLNTFLRKVNKWLIEYETGGTVIAVVGEEK